MIYRIENCDYGFEFRCPLTLDDLQKTDSPNVFFCGECQNNVYLCESKEEFDQLAQAKRCTMVHAGLYNSWFETKKTTEELLLGIPVFR